MKRWKSFAVLASILVCGIGVAGAAPISVKRNPGESDTAFVQRITKQPVVPDEADHPQIASTTALMAGAQTLIAFTEQHDPSDPDPEYDIGLNAFVKKPDGSYTWIGNTVACEIEGGSATLRSFFYVSPDGRPEVAVICGWDATHRYADCQANDEVRLFTVGADVDEVPMEKYKSLFYRQDKRSGCTFSKFRNAADVKKLLKPGPGR